ncbi:hypothetical protein MTO96_023556 [Rhipicephalus appendiculatus]
MISELKRENAILRAENSKLRGGAPRPQQSQQQATMPPPPSPQSLTPSRPEAAGMDTDDESSSGKGRTDARTGRPPLPGSRIALDPARPEPAR